ncbi:MAG: DUF507 family protein [Nitrospirae bacterium]|nr:MAG: DUF507 family protein [Nitrospirota bacterium]
MSPLLSEEKQTHLAHVILESLRASPLVTFHGDRAVALREIKRVLADQIQIEQIIDQTVRSKLQSYSRPIPEGSAEWEILYRKAYTEELRKRKWG